MIEEIRQTIEAALGECEVHVFDPHNDGQHFESIVVSSKFDGMPLVRQHQMVLNALKEKFETTVHAVQLKTFTPQKWAAEKSKYIRS